MTFNEVAHRRDQALLRFQACQVNLAGLRAEQGRLHSQLTEVNALAATFAEMERDLLHQLQFWQASLEDFDAEAA